MHIPKTAGMALRLFLGNQFPVAERMPANDWIEFLQVDVGFIDNYRLFYGHFGCGIFDLLPPDVRSLVFLREPVARTISHLKHLRRDPSFHPAHKLAAGRSLDELVRDERVISLCCNVQTAQLCNDIPASTILDGLRLQQSRGRPLTTDGYVRDPDLVKARESLARFHFVGLVETIEQDLLQMSIAFGLHPPRSLPRTNADPEGADDPAALHPETLAILRQRNALDIALYEALLCGPRINRGTAAAALMDHGVYAPISRPTEIPMSGPIPGSNWYVCDNSGGASKRWTGPSTETTLDLPLAAGHRFEFTLSIGLSDLDNLSVEAGGVDLPLVRRRSEGRSHRISFWVPAAAVTAGGLTTISFRTNETSRGLEADLRQLSFLVTQLAISRVVAETVSSQPAAGSKTAAGEAALLPQDGGEQASPEDAADLREEQLDRELQQMRSYLSEVLAAVKAPVAGYARQVGKSAGLFHDGWVGREASFRLLADRPVTGIAVKGFIPDEFPQLNRVFDIVIDGQAFRFALATNGSFHFGCPVTIAAETTFDLALRCDSDYNAGAAGKGADRRNLAYALNAIELSHEDRPAAVRTNLNQ